MAARDRVQRALVISEDEATRSAIEGALSAAQEPFAVLAATSFTEGLEMARATDPGCVLLELGPELGLALDVARQLRQVGRHIVGLYNPLLEQSSAGAFFRRATRAGVADFVALPAAAADLLDALRNAPPAAAGDAEGSAVTFLSARGGVGTTTLATSTGLVSAGSGAVDGTVGLCDLDLQFGTAADILGLSVDRDVADFAADIDAIETLPAYLARHAETGLRVLPRPRRLRAADELSPEAIRRVLVALKRRFELLVVDTAPALDAVSLAALDFSEAVIVLTDTLRPSVDATLRLIEALDTLGFHDRLALVTSGLERGDSGLAVEEIASRAGIEVAIELPYEKNLRRSIQEARPLVLADSRSPYTGAVGDLAERLVDAIARRRPAEAVAE